jgi:sporulation related protein
MTRATRWLIVVSVGMLLFGILCFGSGVFLGIYLGGARLPAAAALGLPSSASLLSAVPPTAAPAAAIARQTPATAAPAEANSQAAGQSAATPAAPAAAAQKAPAKPPTAVAVPGAPAAEPAPAATNPTAAAEGTTEMPVLAVADLQVGPPAATEPASELRGSLVAAAEEPTKHKPQGEGPAGQTVNGASGSSSGAARAFGVRVGIYLDAAAAQRRAAALQQNGYRPLVLSSQQPAEGLSWYSVVLGRVANLLAARRIARQFAHDQQQEPEIISWALAPPAPAAGPAAGPPTQRSP